MSWVVFTLLSCLKLVYWSTLVSGKIRWYKIEARPDFKIYKYSFILKNQTYTSLMLTKYNKYASDSHRFLKRNARRWRLVSTFCCQTLSLGGHLVNVADHVEGDLRKVIVLAGQDGLEARDCLVNGDQLARVVGENLSDLNNGIIRMRSNKQERWELPGKAGRGISRSSWLWPPSACLPRTTRPYPG